MQARGPSKPGARSSAECCVDNTADTLLGIIVPIGTKPEYGAVYHYCAAARRNNAALAQRRSMLIGPASRTKTNSRPPIIATSWMSGCQGWFPRSRSGGAGLTQSDER